MANAKSIEAWCKHKIDEMEKSIINDLSLDIEARARRNFNRVSSEVPASDTFVDVFCIKGNKDFQIVCGGTQVLFIEFGAGITLANKTQMTTNEFNQKVEKAPRPVGIVGIGEYGKGYGKNDKWYFSEINLIPTTRNNHTKMVKSTQSGKLIYITEGIRPTRSLYNAVSNGIKSFINKGVAR